MGEAEWFWIAMFVWFVLLPLVVIYRVWLEEQPSDNYKQQVREHEWKNGGSKRYCARQMADEIGL